MTEMRVVDLCTCRQTSNPIVLLEDVDRSRWLSFYLPMNEANRLARVLGKTCCAGVPIFDLIGEIADAGGLELVRAEIDGDQQGVNASLVVRRDGHDMAMTCHPADALALALRARVPILASDAALVHACPADNELRAQAVRRWLDRLRPADFDDGSAAAD
jgi:bifunctional DNase/RNase